MSIRAKPVSAALALLVTCASTASAQPQRRPEARTAAESQRAWGWVATAVGSALLVTGAYSYARAGSLAGGTPARCDDRAPDGDAGCDRARWRRIFWTAAPAGVAATTVGVVLLATAPAESPDRAIWRMDASAGTRSVSVRFGGTF